MLRGELTAERERVQSPAWSPVDGTRLGTSCECTRRLTGAPHHIACPRTRHSTRIGVMTGHNSRVPPHGAARHATLVAAVLLLVMSIRFMTILCECVCCSSYLRMCVDCHCAAHHRRTAHHTRTRGDTLTSHKWVLRRRFHVWTRRRYAPSSTNGDWNHIHGSHDKLTLARQPTYTTIRNGSVSCSDIQLRVGCCTLLFLIG